MAAGGFVWQCKIRAPNHPRNKQACAPSQVDDKQGQHQHAPPPAKSVAALARRARPRPERQLLVWFGLHDMSVPIEGHGWADGTMEVGRHAQRSIQRHRRGKGDKKG